MKTIIKEGDTAFETECQKCGCYFRYDLIDVTGRVVSCPQCGEYCAHNVKNAVRTGEMDDI